MEYKGSALFVKTDSLRSNLKEDEFLIDDLTDCSAYTLQDVYIGKVAFVNKQGKSDLLTIKNDEGKEFLVPFVKELVPEVDLSRKKIIINAIEGLIE